MELWNEKPWNWWNDAPPTSLPDRPPASLARFRRRLVTLRRLVILP